jgi:hypothetical protein
MRLSAAGVDLQSIVADVTAVLACRLSPLPMPSIHGSENHDRAGLKLLVGGSTTGLLQLLSAAPWLAAAGSVEVAMLHWSGEGPAAAATIRNPLQLQRGEALPECQCLAATAATARCHACSVLL